MWSLKEGRVCNAYLDCYREGIISDAITGVFIGDTHRGEWLLLLLMLLPHNPLLPLARSPLMLFDFIFFFYDINPWIIINIQLECANKSQVRVYFCILIDSLECQIYNKKRDENIWKIILERNKAKIWNKIKIKKKETEFY